MYTCETEPLFAETMKPEKYDKKKSINIYLNGIYLN